MKILIITSLYSPYSKGGVERVVENIVDGLIKKGDEVIIATTKPLFTNEEKGETKIIHFYPWNLFWFGDIDKKHILLRLPWHIIDIFNIHSYFKIKKILKQEKPAIVMTHNLKGIGYSVPIAIKHSKIKHIHTIHDVQLAEPSGLIFQENKKTNFIKFFFIALYTAVNKKLFTSPDVIISPSEWLLNFYTKKGFFKNSKKIIMRNPIQKFPALTNGTPLQTKGNEEFFKEKISQINTLNLLYIGQIEEHKGILFLIKNLKNLKNISLTIIGTGTKLDEIKKICEGNENIKIIGFIKNNLLNTYFIQNDFLILPSLCFENTPTVIYESFINSTPVIASDIGGIGELIKNGYNGYSFKAGNKENLLYIIKKIIKEKNNWNNLQENAKKSITGQGIEEYIDKLLKL